MTIEQFEEWSLVIGIGGLVLFMVFIVWSRVGWADMVFVCPRCFESAWAQYVPTLLGFLPGTGRLIYSRTPPILVGGQPAVTYRERYALDVRIERDHSAAGFFLRVRHLNTGPSVANLVRDQAMLPHIEHAAQLNPRGHNNVPPYLAMARFEW